MTCNNNIILFFCEGSPERGFGHVSRCLALAISLRDEHGQKCHFVFRGSKTARNKINEAGFEMTEVAEFDSWKFTDEAAMIIDLLVPLDASFFENAHSRNVLSCTLDDPTNNRLNCKMAFYPPVPQVLALGWDDFSGERLTGWEYIPLRKEFSQINRTPESSSTVELLITMGGSDPEGLTLRVLRALQSVSGDWLAKVIVGPMFSNLDEITQIAEQLGAKVSLLDNVKNMANLMVNCTAAIASFGTTAYELAACQTPQGLLCLTDDHALSASALHAAGAAESLGRHDRISDQDLIEFLQRFVSDKQMRASMHSNAKKLAIGNGASNISSAMVQRLEQR